jgi:hypothetical protein
MDSFAEVALHLARVQGSFHYLVPPSLISVLGPGHLVSCSTAAGQGIVPRRSAGRPWQEMPD